MCDYLLVAIPNRLAVSGEELVTYEFKAGAIELASSLDLRRMHECREVQSHGF